ncbi:hypothetical protein GA0070606_5137 [Micromonospora citrea]|uniref:Uncharacterized protein n=1 Tax=Micromonospora citrea TaxID=47855 RepID=A0A1C6VTW0_9ACTN|nr:hypothetical protein [Micromonospora citrea]SCL69617.1 hypothetical protein GA0070606_5137 [Micromonospora citrea]
METSAARTDRAVPPPGHPPHDDAHTGSLPRVVTGRRRVTLLVLAVVAVLSATALVVGLLSWSPDRSEPPRALTGDERDRLAAMRVTNVRDLRAGVRVTAGAGPARTELVGWVDWSRPLLYLDVGGPGAGAERGLLQATPTVAVLRPDPSAVPTPAPPPLVPPAGRWRLHDPAAGRGLAAVLDLLFRLGADRPEPPAESARWVGRATVGAEPVDILQAPPPIQGTPPSAPAARRYWLDRDARLHRLETELPGLGPVTVQLTRTDRPTLRPVDALGGHPGQPRALTAAERGRLDRLPGRLRAAGGAAVTLAAPLAAGTDLRGTGWVSWTGPVAYVTLADLGTPERRTLLRIDAAGVTRAEVPAATVPGGVEAPGRPPLPPPARGWRADPARAGDLGLLLDAALRAARSPGQRGTALRVRGDSLAGKSVDVVELRTSRALLRYWIDRSGLLRRLELRTRPGAWAQLDLAPGATPRLPPVGPAPQRPRTPTAGR